MADIVINLLCKDTKPLVNLWVFGLNSRPDVARMVIIKSHQQYLQKIRRILWRRSPLPCGGSPGIFLAPWWAATAVVVVYRSCEWRLSTDSSACSSGGGDWSTWATVSALGSYRAPASELDAAPSHAGRSVGLIEHRYNLVGL